MSKSTLMKVVVGVVLVCAVLAGAITGVGFFLRQRQGLPGAETSDAKIPKRPPSTMTVHITDPIGATNLKTGEILPIHGQVLSNYPVASLELWVNGDLVEVRKPPVGIEKTFFLALWNWRAPAAGTYKLNLRGIDLGGRSAYSSMVTVRADDMSEQDVSLQIQPTPESAQLTPAPGETPGIPLVGPVIKPAGGNAPGVPGGIPASGSEEQPPSAPDPNLPPNPNPGDIPTPSDEDTGPVLGEPVQSTFIVKVTVTQPDGCSVDLEIEDLNHQASGFYIERSAPQETNYYPITVLKAEISKSSHYLDNSAKYEGAYYYNIMAYNSTGQQVLEPIEVSYGGDCANETWNGVVFADLKVIPKDPVDELYCYIWLNNLPWQRIPAPAESSIPPMSTEDLRLWNTNLNTLMQDSANMHDYNFTSGYDLTPFAPDLSKTGFDQFDLSIQCVNRTSETAINLGTATTAFSLTTTDLLTKMSTEQFDAYVFISSKVMLGNQPSINIGIASPFDVEAYGDTENCPPEIRGWCDESTRGNYVILRWKWKPKPCFYNDMPGDPEAKMVCIEEPLHFTINRYTSNPQYTNVGYGHLNELRTDGYFYSRVPYPQDDTDPNENDTYADKAKKDALGLKEYCIRAGAINFAGGYLASEDFQESCVRLKDLDMPASKTIILLKPMDGLNDMGVYVNGQANEDTTSAGGDLSFLGNYPPHHLYTGLSIDGEDDLRGLVGMDWWFAYGYFKFDLEPLMGKQIHSAKLMLGDNIAGSAYILSDDGKTNLDLESACSRGLMVLNRTGSPGWHNASPPNATVTHSYINQKMNVTDEVRMWTEGSMTNNGFMFGIWPAITVENFRSWSCDIDYGPMQLIVEYSDK